MNRAERLKKRMVKAGSLEANIQVKKAETGKDILDALESASARGPIKNLVTYGHSWVRGLYMHNDKGFYRAGETGDEPGGARHISDLKTLMDQGKVRFSNDAVALFLSCGCSGSSTFDSASFAAEFTKTTGVTSIAAVGLSEPKGGDDSQQHSQVKWVKIVRKTDASGNFTLEQTPLGSDVDPMNYVKKDDAAPSPAPQQQQTGQQTTTPSQQQGASSTPTSTPATSPSGRSSAPAAAEGRVQAKKPWWVPMSPIWFLLGAKN